VPRNDRLDPIPKKREVAATRGLKDVRVPLQDRVNKILIMVSSQILQLLENSVRMNGTYDGQNGENDAKGGSRGMPGHCRGSTGRGGGGRGVGREGNDAVPL